MRFEVFGTLCTRAFEFITTLPSHKSQTTTRSHQVDIFSPTYYPRVSPFGRVNQSATIPFAQSDYTLNSVINIFALLRTKPPPYYLPQTQKFAFKLSTRYPTLNVAKTLFFFKAPQPPAAEIKVFADFLDFIFGNFAIYARFFGLSFVARTALQRITEMINSRDKDMHDHLVDSISLWLCIIKQGFYSHPFGSSGSKIKSKRKPIENFSSQFCSKTIVFSLFVHNWCIDIVSNVMENYFVQIQAKYSK
ncbi:hypothetical protein G9A89_012155 [Geosiphon pyriformis]|nr:hypothetical protein G9A89_012155 [Geosiphon pyriformis]